MMTTSYSADEKSFLYVMFAQVMYGETAVFKQMFKTKLDSFKQVDESVYKVFAKLATTKEDELVIQYENLFFIPGSHYVPPYISKYICENDSEAEQVLLGKLAELYETTGFISYADNKYLRHDHLGHLLMFQHFLLVKRSDATGQEQQVIDGILDDIVKTMLLPTFGKFEQRVSKVLTKGFYLDIVQLIHQFIDQEAHNA